MTQVAQRKIKDECSLTSNQWFLFNIYFHPENKATISEIRSWCIPDVLDYEEALNAITIMKEAVSKDHERESKVK